MSAVPMCAVCLERVNNDPAPPIRAYRCDLLPLSCVCKPLNEAPMI